MTTFIETKQPPNVAADKSWCFTIGTVEKWPGLWNQTGRYGFAVGIRVYGLETDPVDYSMDPEMDVSI
jgi:hypothetical protein